MVMCMTKKMSQILIDANQELQIVGNYLKDWDKEKKKAKGYCALGILACQTENVSVDGYVPETSGWIGETFNISHDDIHDFKICPACKDDWSCLEYCGCNKESPRKANIGTLIVHMNDEHEMEFKEIGEYLEKMGY